MFKQTIIICFCDFKAENYVTNENFAAFSVKDINMNYKHTIVFFVASFPIYTGKKGVFGIYPNNKIWLSVQRKSLYVYEKR